MLKFCVTTSGAYNANFNFNTEEERDKWLKTEFIKLAEKFDKTTPHLKELDDIEVGDICFVYGEGTTRFKVTGVHKWDDNYYGFVLDHSVIEEVSKCYKYPFDSTQEQKILVESIQETFEALLHTDSSHLVRELADEFFTVAFQMIGNIEALKNNCPPGRTLCAHVKITSLITALLSNFIMPSKQLIGVLLGITKLNDEITVDEFELECHVEMND